MNDSHAALDQLATAAAGPKRLFTYDELLAEFPDSNRPFELWDGEIVMAPSPFFDHQEVVFRVARWLHAWVSERHLGKVVTAPVDMVLSPHRVFQPDIVFIAQGRLGIIRKAIHGPVDLAVEVISLGSRNRDRIEKRDIYEQYGIKEYWLIDPEAQTVDVLSLENDRYRLIVRATGEQVASSRLLPGFECRASDVFFGD
jgi:Uma2 family endonuclease